MEKKQNFLIRPLLLMGLFLAVASSCKKNDDNGFPALSTSEVMKIAQTKATSGGTITYDGGFVITARGVCWSLGGNPTIADNKTSDGPGAGSFSSELTGLMAGMTYYVRAYATNSQGTGYGSTMVFQTIGNTFTDARDGNVYKIVTIGNQLWMAENLKYLPEVFDHFTASETTPYYYVYGYSGTNVIEAKATANYGTYGVLYNWEAANTACPVGWNLPGDAEWIELSDYLGGESIAGGKLKEAGTTHWVTPNTGATNETGFTALPAGLRAINGFGNIGNYGYWWSSNEYSSTHAWIQSIGYDQAIFGSYYFMKELGFSVRCVRDID